MRKETQDSSCCIPATYIHLTSISTITPKALSNDAGRLLLRLIFRDANVKLIRSEHVSVSRVYLVVFQVHRRLPFRRVWYNLFESLEQRQQVGWLKKGRRTIFWYTHLFNTLSGLLQLYIWWLFCSKQL